MMTGNVATLKIGAGRVAIRLICLSVRVLPVPLLYRLAVMFSAIANNGYRVTPHLVEDRTQARKGRSQSQTDHDFYHSGWT